MRPDTDLSRLIDALLEPAHTRSMSAGEWNSLLRTARRFGLAARLAHELRAGNLWETVPPRAHQHLNAAALACLSTHTAVDFELDRAWRALASAGLDVPLVLMKGGAYLAAGLAASRGRMIGDLDLMVPRERVGEVEAVLTQAGWRAAPVDDYDEHYYREWMHEIPPLTHPQRQTPIDLHHTILPLTGRIQPDAAALHADAVALPGGRLKVLAPADMVLHGAVHLFHAESAHPLRDLFDQRELMTGFGTDAAFWPALVDRARLHGLQRTLFYTLRYTGQIFALAVPSHVAAAVGPWGPPAPMRWLMDWLLLAHLLGTGERAGVFARAGHWLAGALLLARSHWLKMPPAMLARHLTRKTFKRWATWREARRQARAA